MCLLQVLTVAGQSLSRYRHSSSCESRVNSDRGVLSRRKGNTEGDDEILNGGVDGITEISAEVNRELDTDAAKLVLACWQTREPCGERLGKHRSAEGPCPRWKRKRPICGFPAQAKLERNASTGNAVIP